MWGNIIQLEQDMRMTRFVKTRWSEITRFMEKMLLAFDLCRINISNKTKSL